MRLILTAIACCFFMGINAQVLTTEDWRMDVIPSTLTSEELPVFYMYKENINTSLTSVNVYNGDFSVEKQFEMDGTTYNLYCLNYIDFDNNSNSDRMSTYISQTFFNNDEKFEYIKITKVDDSYKDKTLSIINEDGDVLFSLEESGEGTFRFDEPGEGHAKEWIQAFKFRGKKYLYIFYCTSLQDGMKGRAYLYEVDTMTGIKQASASVAKMLSKVYNTEGIQLSPNANGIIISNGKKVIK